MDEAGHTILVDDDDPGDGAAGVQRSGRRAYARGTTTRDIRVHLRELRRPGAHWRGEAPAHDQWQCVKKNSAPVGVVLKWSVTWLEKLEPSEPVPRTLSVKVPLTDVPLALNPPQMVSLPV